jgi:flagellar hook-basal body complex protein FliE
MTLSTPSVPAAATLTRAPSPLDMPASAGPPATSAAEAIATPPFAESLQQLLTDTSSLQQQSAERVAQLATGQTDSLQEVVVAAAKADLAFRFVLELRNRLISAYQEIMRMQV